MLVASLLATLAFAAAARASVYCVNEPSCAGTEEGTTSASLKAALAAAASHPNVSGLPDEVLIGPGTYSLEEGFSYTNSEPVIVRGAGAGSTVLTRPAASGADVLLLRSAESSVADLTIRVPEREDLQGARLEGGTLEDDTIEASGQALGATGLRLESGIFTHGTISVLSGTGIDQRGGEVLYSTIGATLGFGVQVSTAGTLRGDVISGRTPLVSYYAFPLILEDSLIEMGGTDPSGVEIAGNAGGETEAVLAQDAIVGGGHTGLVVRAATHIAAIFLDDSIISEAEVPIRIEAEGKGNLATLLGEYSSFEQAKDIELPGSEANVSLSDVHGVSTLPSFVSPLTGDFHLAPGSPLIDAGTEGAELTAGDFKTDLAGNPRIVHGRRDVGPYEYQWRPPVVAASANATSAVKGEVLTFSGSATAAEPGDSVTSYQWTFDDGSAVHAGASASHAFSTTGAHRATLTATDAQGVVGTATVGVAVVSEACSASACGTAVCQTSACGLEVTHILRLALSAHSLRAARRGTSVGKGHAGVRVSYTLAGRADKVIFTVVRKGTGIRVGKRCLAARKGRHGHGCSLRLRVPGAFEQPARRGSNSFRFTGRIGGKELLPGTYVLVAEIKGQSGSAAEAPFTIIG